MKFHLSHTCTHLWTALEPCSDTDKASPKPKLSSSCSICPWDHPPWLVWSWNLTDLEVQLTPSSTAQMHLQFGIWLKPPAKGVKALNQWHPPATTSELHSPTQTTLVHHSHWPTCTHTHFRPSKRDLTGKIPKCYLAMTQMWLSLYLKVTFIRNCISSNKKQWDSFFFFLLKSSMPHRTF